MTVSKTTLLNLTRWSSDTDPWNRDDFDDDNAELEARVGPLTSKPVGVGVTPATGVTSSTGTKSYLRGTIAVVNVHLTLGAGFGNPTALFTLPVGHRPPAIIEGNLVAVGTSSGAYNGAAVNVATTGVVTLVTNIDGGGAYLTGTILRGQLIIPL